MKFIGTTELDRKLAKLTVKHSLKVKKGEKIFISGSEMAAPLIKALYAELLEVGAHPFIFAEISGTDEILLKLGSKEQLKFVPPVENYLMNNYDGRIYILTYYNSRKFEKIPLERIQAYQSTKERGKTRIIREKKVADGKFKWVAIPYPTQTNAQDAGMSYLEFQEFMAKALKLNNPDPVEEWKNFGLKQQKLVDYLNDVQDIHIKTDNTDLKFSVKGRTWKNACGYNNLPDGEVFTGPVENSLNGYIKFEFPNIFQNRRIEDIYLEFKSGKVVHANASKGNQTLQNIIKITGADHVGEFAFGTNYDILDFTNYMLFDEKTGGTIHLALGNGHEHTGSKNRSSIHWDILKEMRNEDCCVYADNNLIYQAGKFLI